MSKSLLLSLIALTCFAAPAVAQTPCYAENDGNNFSDNVSLGGPNLTVGIKFVAPANFAVTRIEVFTGEATGINTIGIYSHDAGLNQPLAWLGNNTWSMSPTNG
jgi:hypothetical protein